MENSEPCEGCKKSIADVSRVELSESYMADKLGVEQLRSALLPRSEAASSSLGAISSRQSAALPSPPSPSRTIYLSDVRAGGPLGSATLGQVGLLLGGFNPRELTENITLSDTFAVDVLAFQQEPSEGGQGANDEDQNAPDSIAEAFRKKIDEVKGLSKNDRVPAIGEEIIENVGSDASPTEKRELVASNGNRCRGEELLRRVQKQHVKELVLWEREFAQWIDYVAPDSDAMEYGKKAAQVKSKANEECAAAGFPLTLLLNKEWEKRENYTLFEKLHEEIRTNGIPKEWVDEIVYPLIQGISCPLGCRLDYDVVKSESAATVGDPKIECRVEKVGDPYTKDAWNKGDKEGELTPRMEMDTNTGEMVPATVQLQKWRMVLSIYVPITIKLAIGIKVFCTE